MNDVVDITEKLLANKSNLANDVYERILSCKENGSSCTCKYCSYRKKAAEMLIEVMLRDISTIENKTGTVYTSYDLKKIIYLMYDMIEEKERESIYKPIKGDLKLEE